MKIKEFFKELEELEVYKEFSVKYPDAYLCAGFFIFETGEREGDKFQFDFFIPSLEKIAIFEYPFSKFSISEEAVKKCSPVDFGLKVDIDNLKEKIEEIKLENEASQETSKIIAILRDNNWAITCLDNFLGILKMKINALTGKCDDFEKGSLMDFMKIIKK